MVNAVIKNKQKKNSQNYIFLVIMLPRIKCNKKSSKSCGYTKLVPIKMRTRPTTNQPSLQRWQHKKVIDLIKWRCNANLKVTKQK